MATRIETQIRSLPEYPTKSAILVHIAGRWNASLDCCPGPVVRHLVFRSVTPQSSLDEVDLLEYNWGEIGLYISFEGDKFEDYLRACGFSPYSSHFCRTHNYRELCLLFKIIAQNNELPPKEFSLILSAIGQSRLAHSILEDEKLPTQPLVLERRRLALTYPGMPASFMAVNAWEAEDERPGMKLISITANSLIKEFSFSGYLDGRVGIQVIFNESHLEELERYLKEVYEIPYDGLFLYGTGKIELVRRLFSFIEEHNKIPEAELAFIKSTLDVGVWKSIIRITLSVSDFFSVPVDSV
jgi:hypothetical protein